jgi:transcriptional regulator with XRE-family HTH domain
MAITQRTPSQSQTAAEEASSPAVRRLQLSSSMEKSFRRYQTNRAARHAFVEAEAAVYLAHQIRVLRLQRGWTQHQLARELRTTQAAVSRMEDDSYGRMTFKTLVALARVFDVAPLVKFVSTVGLMRDRWNVDRSAMAVAPFDVEAAHVVFANSLPPGNRGGVYELHASTASVTSFKEVERPVPSAFLVGTRAPEPSSVR